MSNSLPILYYIHDPMCSWCWGFRPVWNEVQTDLAGKVNIRYLLGGLAPDTDEIMPESMQRSIRSTWQRIQQEIPGTEFNYDFWTDCRPRRSTYPACRAVIAAGLQANKYSKDMLLAIQQAYYLQAKNPSDVAVLIQLSAQIGLDVKKFEADILSENCNELLDDEISLTRQLGVSGFPSLELSHEESNTLIHINYTDSEVIVSDIMALL
jgi:putative protein-disulfide isomerase